MKRKVPKIRPLLPRATAYRQLERDFQKLTGIPPTPNIKACRYVKLGLSQWQRSKIVVESDDGMDGG